MALLELNVDMSRTATALERIADALQLLVQFHIDPATVRLHRKATAPEEWQPPKPEEQLRVVSDEALWEREQQEEQAKLAAMGLPSQEE